MSLTGKKTIDVLSLAAIGINAVLAYKAWKGIKKIEENEEIYKRVDKTLKEMVEQLDVEEASKTKRA